VYPVVASAVESNVDLVFGEGRFPAFSLRSEAADDEGALPEDAAQELERFLAKYHEVCRFRTHARMAYSAAQACGTAVGVHGVRFGKPFADLLPARWCEPVFATSGEVERLEIQYPYLETYRDARGQWGVRAKLYRRVLTADTDTTYRPADADENGREPSWSVDPARSVEHGLGFCPVVWYPFQRGCQSVNVIDGVAIHADLREEIKQHDIARSQLHRGALMSEPQIVETGVAPGTNPTDPGETASLPHVEKDAVTGEQMVVGEFRRPRNKLARKKGPGYVWQFSSADARVQILTYPGEALKAQADNCSDLLQKIQEGLAVVFLDPNNIKFAATTSGKALQAIKQRQVDRCDQHRDDLRDGFLAPTVSMQLRIVAKLGGSVRLPGADNAAALLRRFDSDGVG